MGSAPSLSVVIATHARAASLARTLDAIVDADRGGLVVEVVVVENGPPGGAEAVVNARRQSLPLRYLHHARASKSEAANRAIEAGGLADIVVFTDDDALPERGWLQAVASACRLHAEHDVFGGRIEITWPDGPRPGWATRDAWVRAFAFGEHVLGDAPVAYRGDLFPYGPNWWLRRCVLDQGRRFDPAFGPREGRWFSGEETSFLWRLAQEGTRALHVPDAVVHHAVRPDQLTRRWIRRRAWKEGVGRGALERPLRAGFLRRHPRLWRLEQAGRVGRAAVLYAGTRLRPPTTEATLASIRALRRLGGEVGRFHHESVHRPKDGEAR